MNTPSLHTTSFRNALLAISLAAGLGMISAACAESTVPQPHSDGVGAMLADTAITAKVKAKLLGEQNLKKSEISVTTTNGVVTLDGSASDAEAKSAAEAAAKSVEGVRSVDNNLTTPGSSKTVAKAKRAVSDSWITTKVKSAILADNVGKGFDVKVETIHGVVVLKGVLANQDAIEHMKDVAARIDGVKSVDTSALTAADE